jgi:hypothetical protein
MKKEPQTNELSKEMDKHPPCIQCTKDDLMNIQSIIEYLGKHPMEQVERGVYYLRSLQRRIENA